MNFYGKRYSYENGLISKEGREVCYLQIGYDRAPVEETLEDVTDPETIDRVLSQYDF